VRRNGNGSLRGRLEVRRVAHAAFKVGAGCSVTPAEAGGTEVGEVPLDQSVPFMAAETCGGVGADGRVS
jgi:hypothetical protein